MARVERLCFYGKTIVSRDTTFANLPSSDLPLHREISCPLNALPRALPLCYPSTPGDCDVTDSLRKSHNGKMILTWDLGPS